MEIIQQDGELTIRRRLVNESQFCARYFFKMLGGPKKNLTRENLGGCRFVIVGQFIEQNLES